MKERRQERIAVHFNTSERRQLQALATMAGYKSLARYVREVSLRLAAVGICVTCNQPGSLRVVIDPIER